MTYSGDSTQCIRFSHSHLTRRRSDSVPASRGDLHTAKRPLRLVPKCRINIASTVQHAHDIDSPIDRGVEDDVSTGRKAARTSGQIFPYPPYQGLRRDELEFLVEIVDPSIGLIQAVFGDVIPNVEDVGSRQRPAGDTCHDGLRGFASPPGPTFTLHCLRVPRLAGATGQTLADVFAQLLLRRWRFEWSGNRHNNGLRYRVIDVLRPTHALTAYSGGS